MTNELPSDKLARKPRPLRAAAIGAAGLLLVVGAAFGVPAAVHAMSPAPKPAPVVAIAGPMECDGTVSGQGDCVTSDEQTAADQQLTQLEADNAAKAKAAADAAAAQAAEQAAKDAAAKKAQSQQGAHVNPDGSVEGAGCPAPYVSDEHGCHSPICEVKDDGTQVPCQG